MTFLCNTRKWTSITRDAWLQTATAAEYELPDNKQSMWRRQLISKQSRISPKQTSTKIIQILKTNTKQKIDYFIVDPGMEAGTAATTEKTLKIND